MARERGELVHWFDEKGFGFIRRPGHAAKLFLHATSVRQTYTRPRIGDQLEFRIGPGRDGREAAYDADIAGVNPRSAEANRRGREERLRPLSSWRLLAAAGLIVLLAAAIVTHHIPDWAVLLYAGMGALSGVLYGLDKRAAEQSRWRRSEMALHQIDLLGGIVGGLLAQQVFRHKTSKTSFAVVTVAIVAVHLALLASALLGLWKN